MNLYKVTKCGNDYTHVVALNPIDAANAYIDHAVKAYEAKTGHKARREAFVDDVVSITYVDSNPIVAHYTEDES